MSSDFFPIKFQIGKAGVTEGTLDSLVLAFKNHNQIRISVLKSSGRDKSNIESMAQDLSTRLRAKTGKKHPFRVIGFTIILKR